MTELPLDRVSTRPGVYLFRAADGEILYVGKAKNLRNRVRSYFRSGSGIPIKTRELVKRIRDFETIVVGSEAEALILEANLIKEHQPRFNIQLRDDKSYPYVKVTVGEPFPRVFVTRNPRNDGSRYFGPFTSVTAVRQAVERLCRENRIRSCRYDLPKEAPKRPCLDAHIGRCFAPCVGGQSPEDYREAVGRVVRVLGGEIGSMRSEIEAEMSRAADALEFERAAELRNTLKGLDAFAGVQRVQEVEGGNQDVVGIARDADTGIGIVLRLRGGNLLGRETQSFSGLDEEDDAALIESFVTRHYLGGGDAAFDDLPRTILVPGEFDSRDTLAALLSERAGHRVELSVPQRGRKRRLVQLAETNARHLLTERIGAEGDGRLADRADDALYGLQDRLALKVVPRLMVCFDISHLQGKDTVASAVVFENGHPKRSEYRRMRIRGEWGNDDIRSMEEVVGRYFLRRDREERPIPDLAVIDGGKGQLAAARRSLEELGMGDTAVIALAKRQEEVFVPGGSEPIHLDRRDRALHLLQRIRDEAHRFAVEYNRKLRSRRTVKTELDEIPGVGPARSRQLLKRFGSLAGVRAASQDQIASLPGFGPALAAKILTYLAR